MTPPKFPTPAARLAMQDFLFANKVDMRCYAKSPAYRKAWDREELHMAEASRGIVRL